MSRPFGFLLIALAALLALGGGTAEAARLYVPLYYNVPQAISVFDRAADGGLTQLAGSPFGIVSSPSPVGGIGGMAFAPEGTRAAVSFYFEGGVLGLTVGSDGKPVPAQAPLTASTGLGIAVSPDGHFAYTPDGSGGVRGYSFASSGALAPLAGSPFGSGGAYDVAITPDGRFLFASGSNQVSRFSIGASGVLSYLGATPLADATYVSTSPDGRFLFVGITNGGADGVVSMSIGADGSLTQNGSPALTGDVAMGYFGVSVDGTRIYMPDSNRDAVVTAAVAADGTLSVIGATAAENAESVVASPDGRFLYWLTPQNGGMVGTMAIGANGIPTLLPVSAPWSSGEDERMVLQPTPAPSASFTAKPAPPGAASSFDARASQGAVRYDWEFGDGTTLANGGATPQHTYASSGVYTVKLRVTDAQGCSATQLYTGQSTVCPGGSAAVATATVDTPPVISALSVKNRRFAVPPPKGKARTATASGARPKLGTAFRYTLTEAARVQFKIERKSVGTKVGGKCKPSKGEGKAKGKRCVTWRKASPPLIVKGKAGRNVTPYSGRRRGGKVLAPGSYRARAVATDTAGGRSAPRYVSFRVIPG